MNNSEVTLNGSNQVPSTISCCVTEKSNINKHKVLSNSTSVENKKYTKESKIATGTYGRVYKCHSPKGSRYGIKCNIKRNETSFLGIVSELDINYRLGIHPYIITLETIAQGDPFTNIPLSPVQSNHSSMDKVHFVYPLAVGDLRSYVRLNLTSISLEDAKRYMCEILLGMEYIHAKGFIHRDIKSDNILVIRDQSGQTHMNIGDFGLSKPFIDNIPNTPGVMTSWFRPPEICLGDPYYTKISDMWSVGCVFYELISGKPLTGDKPDNDLILIQSIVYNLPYNIDTMIAFKMDKLGMYKKINYISDTKTPSEFLMIGESSKERFNSIGGIDQFYNMVIGLLAFDPAQRSTATAALDNKFFDDSRPLICDTRAAYIPTPRKYGTYKIANDKIERKWVMATVLGLYKNKVKFQWFTDRILFQSISIMDRALTAASKFADKSIVESEILGTIFPKETTELYYIASLYLTIKYFTSLHIPFSFISIASPEYCTPANILKVNRFEDALISTILKYDFYNPTPYDIMMDTRKADQNDVHSMLVYIINGHHNNRTPTDAYEFWNKNKDYYMRAV